jgi:transcriptional regulator with XRE-family HTH domain
MSTKQRAADKGSARARSILSELANEMRIARLNHGLSQSVVAQASGVCRSQVSRLELGQAPRATVLELSRLLEVVGLELSARAYPAGPPIRDAAHRALIKRLRALVSPSVAWRFEVPVGGAGDLRAWDAVLLIGTNQFAVEAETRLREVQELQRRLSLKRRDDREVSGVLLLLADTRNNRRLAREHGEDLRSDFPLPAREILTALADGRCPNGSGIALL